MGGWTLGVSVIQFVPDTIVLHFSSLLTIQELTHVLHRFPHFILLLISLACTTGDSGDSGKIRPVGSSATAAPDTTASEPQKAATPAATATAKKAQRAWDTAAAESFDVEELNLKRAVLTGKRTPNKIDTIRLKPSYFPNIPENVANWLEERDYTIPQTMFCEIRQFCNVRRGEFIVKGQQDLAVLAVIDTVMDLLVFEKSTTDSVHFLIKNVPALWGLASLYMSSAPDSTVRLLYGIETFGNDEIKYFYEAFDWPEPPEIAHQAIWYSLLEESSIFFYYHNGVWQQVEEAD